MIEKRIGKIRRAYFGRGGYQDAMLGFSFELGGDGWGTGDFFGTWAEHTERCKWTAAEQHEVFADAVARVGKLLSDAHKDTLSELEGVPVEVTFVDCRLDSWRILTEAI